MVCILKYNGEMLGVGDAELVRVCQKSISSAIGKCIRVTGGTKIQVTFNKKRLFFLFP